MPRLSALLLVALRACQGERSTVRLHTAAAEIAGFADVPREARLGSQRLFPCVALAIAIAGARGARAQSGEHLFQALDSNNDGSVSREEYMQAAEDAIDADGVHGGRTVKWYMDLFDKSDLNGDGSLNELEAEFLGHIFRDAVFAPSRQSSGAGGRPIETLFSELDLNGDGKIDREEFMMAMRDGARYEGWGNDMDLDIVAWAGGIFSKSDVDADGVLSLGELHFSRFLIRDDIRDGRFLEKKFATAMFRGLDTNEDGMIEDSELAEAMAELAAELGSDGTTRPPSMLERVQRRFSSADRNRDRRLDRKEAEALAKNIIDGRY